MNVSIRNYIYNTYPIVFHSPMSLPILWEYFRLFRNYQPLLSSKQELNDCMLITWNNKNKRILEKSLNILRCPHTVMGRNITDSQWRNVVKIQLTNEFLENVDTKYVMGVDAFDALFIKHPNHVIKRFQALNVPMLFNASSMHGLTFQSEQLEWEKSLYPDRVFRYLNAGVWIGETEFVKKFFQRAEELSRNQIEIIDECDKNNAILTPVHFSSRARKEFRPSEYVERLKNSEQVVIKWAFREFPKIELDTTQKVFCVLNNRRSLPPSMRTDFGLETTTTRFL